MDMNNRTYAFNATVQVFWILCGVNLAADLPNTNTGVKDIVHVANINSLPLCIDLCARYTLDLPTVQSGSDQTCRYVNLDLQGVCWLKTDSGSSLIKTPNGYASALLSYGFTGNMSTSVQNMPSLGGELWQNIPVEGSGN